ncbi:MAG: pyridoxal phosphate-dependent aminotransferase [Actinobacteria bacterium]|jgi:aspartate/methionine/tyrosine aminotransferase|nr:pyridoxal phosphate-dependent aminotransferase [Actinomycetota bacterium]MBT3686676.1 pyridoxal phosphate-dependent aminotransferase [Actinomycetota bacterium]MBT4037328.1 pyridoxal phosphate-dependent aminotransferase [Actinomycetota bacterium]MBT4278020.1 pyridoxal phosphate-dependent aminotransferase [Actinomycetota bacterium]MBT4343378.1 pyridoxal phosphate-dependent aminotransferase [Actinomycetota bacterium]
MTTQRLSARVGAIAESATMAVTNKARELRAAGEPVIGFGAGEPDFPTPDHIVAAAVAACEDPVNHKYSAAGGLPELKAALVEKTQRDSGWRPEVSQVLVTNGGKHAVYNTCAALLNPGDEVLLPAPYWTTYPECIALAGGTSVVLQTDVASGFRVTVDQLEAARTPDTKALFFVSPSNPSGAVYPADEIRAIGEWAHEHGIWVIADEIYEHLTYDGHEHHSIRALVPDLADTCVVLNGVAKTYAMTGWRVGWMIGPADLVKAAANLQSHATSNVANVSQRAALAAVAGDLTDVVAMREAFDRRRVAMSGLLRQIDGLELLEPQGAFYAYPDMSALLGREIAGRTAATTNELAGIILDEAKVAIVPGEAFGTPGYARLSFALGDADLEEGLTRVVDLLNR